MEFSWHDFGDGGDAGSKVEVTALGAAIVGNLPLGSEVVGFAQLGLSSWDMDVAGESDSGTDVFYGLGADYTIGGSSAVRFLLNIYPMEGEFNNVSYDEQLNVFSVGFLYRM